MKIISNTKFISIGNLKGGCAKSTATFNIGGVLANQGKKVLFIDVDMQANLTYNCGIDTAVKDMVSVKDIFEKGMDPEKIVVKAPIGELPTLDILPSSIFLFETSELLYTYPNKEMILTRYVKKHKDFFSQYDYVIMDTSPSMNALNINCHLLADSVVLVTDMSINGFIGAQLFCELFDKTREAFDLEDNIAAISIQNYDGKSNLAKDFVELLHSNDFSKDIALNTIIKSSVKIKESELAHKPVCIYAPKHQSAEQFENLVQELINTEVL